MALISRHPPAKWNMLRLRPEKSGNGPLQERCLPPFLMERPRGSNEGCAASRAPSVRPAIGAILPCIYPLARKLDTTMTESIYVGKRILVGLTYLTSNGEVREQVQLHGLISSVGDHALSFDKADGSGPFAIPFDGKLNSANPESVYTLRSSGESVTGVNFIASFTIHPPADS